MENCSYFLNNKAYFGSYPTQESVEILEKNGVRIFVDLTYSSESKITSYNTKYLYISFPIKDNYVPTNTESFTRFIYRLVYILRNTTPSEKMYIHCKGGHGRSGIVVACIYCLMFNKSPVNSIRYTTSCHNNRKIMRDKWRSIGSPQTENQKLFVFNTCYNLILDNLNPLSSEFKRSLDINNQEFTTINEAIKHLSNNGDYNKITYFVLKKYVEQDEYFKKMLINSGLKQFTVSQTSDISSIYVNMLSLIRYRLITGSI